jgi:tetratricopeptide (TPR) repeat protein
MAVHLGQDLRWRPEGTTASCHSNRSRNYHNESKAKPHEAVLSLDVLDSPRPEAEPIITTHAENNYNRLRRMPRQKSQHVDDPRLVGERIRAARTRAGLSQSALSFPGCSPAYISRVEAGDRIPSLQVLRELGRQLGVSADFLAAGQEAGDEPAPLVEADVALRLGELDTAEELYRGALKRTLTGEDQGRAHAGLGQLAFRRDETSAAIEHLERAFDLFGEARYNDPTHADTLGRAYVAVGRHAEAIALFEGWLEEMTSRSNEAEEVRFSVLLANALIDGGSFGRAAELLGHALAKSTGWTDPVARASTLWSQSRLHAVQGDSANAARYARRALAILEATELTNYTARAHQLLAFIELDRGNPSEALHLLKTGRALLGDTGTKVEIAKFKLEEARALAQVGESDEAGALAMEAVGLLGEADPPDAGRAYEVLADVFVQIGERDRAKELYELAIESHEQQARPYLSGAYSKLAEILKAEGRTEEALALLEKAVAMRIVPTPL